MYEPIALQQYEKFMFNRKTPVAVLKSGFVVSKSCPVLGASPDAKVVDFGCSLCFGLAEVKCPHTKFHVTPLEACSHPTFFIIIIIIIIIFIERAQLAKAVFSGALMH